MDSVQDIQSTPIILPREKVYLQVVVHVIWKDDIQNISNEQILSQIEVLNQDFSKSNPRIQDLPAVFATLAADTEIQFCLANKTPDGEETSGITRRKTQVQEIGLTDAYHQFAQGGQDAWDVDHYVNIWVADFGDSEVQGFATFPGQAVPKTKDGLLINYKAFGNQGTVEEPHHLGNICSHEMGHYLNLTHIWGPGSGGCEEDDGIADTPLQDFATEACPNFPKPDACTQGNGILFMNFMDYTDDACISMFTQGQKNVMLNCLNNQRNGLLNQIICSDGHDEIPDFQISVYPNPGRHSLFFSEPLENQEPYMILDINGRVLLESNVVANSIDIEHLNAGVYFLKIKQQIIKFVKI